MYKMILLRKNAYYMLTSRMLHTQMLSEANLVFNVQPKHLGASGPIFNLLFVAVLLFL